MTQPLSHPIYTNDQTRGGTLISYNIPWQQPSLLTFLRRASGLPQIYWESSQSPTGFAGFGVAAQFTATGPERFRIIRGQVDQLFENVILMGENVTSAEHAVGPRLFGGFSFQVDTKPQGIWSAFSGACFILPRYQLTRIHDQTWLTVNHLLPPEEDPTEGEWIIKEALWDIPVPTDLRMGNGYPQSGFDGAGSPLDIEGLMDRETWHRIVTRATDRIRRGILDKVVLAQARRVRSRHHVEPTHVLARLGGLYPNCYRFLFEPVPGHAFYGATPELLAEVVGSKLNTVALAGSIRRGKTMLEDRQLGLQLMTSPKDCREHALVVEAIERNLRPLAEELHLPEEPRLCLLDNIQHLQTPITGELADSGGILSVVEVLHPSPAVGGVPQEAALDFIDEAEPHSRGWYAAPIGWIDHRGDGIFAVAIRSAVSVGPETRLFAGSGLVADSVPEAEWRETQLKFRPLLEALGGDGPNGSIRPALSFDEVRPAKALEGCRESA